MTIESVMTLARMAVETSMAVAAPILMAGLVAGLGISVFQAVTQINEMTLTFIPKIIAVGLVIAVFYKFMMNHMLDFTVRMFTTFPAMIR
ncbi:MAG: flagellar biosynthesis protein FliQ [Deltaproteobacteria bacterium]|nr:flagellar biosynthesis protein FliQ [bacterium]MCB9478843.1 flagellar biosynthesis protein FliQ [Deltaproteobacteria bacterium]MCB9488995.1 flagellar biosynthesis protein FliQ [Deltaproteobacteria bacterium]